MVSTTDELTRLIEADVLAVERSDGARATDEPVFARLRTSEAVRFARRISQRLHRSSNLAIGVATAIRSSSNQASTEMTDAISNLVHSLELMAHADEEWATEVRQGLQFGTFLEGLEGTASAEGTPS